MTNNKLSLSTTPKWFFLILGIFLLIWSIISQVRGIEYSLIKHKHIDTIVSIQSIGTILYSAKHYSITIYSVTIRFIGIPVRRIFWDNIAGIIIFDLKKNTESMSVLFVPDYLDFSTVTSMTNEQIQNNKWKNSVLLTIPKVQLNMFSELVHQCGKELIMR